MAGHDYDTDTSHQSLSGRKTKNNLSFPNYFADTWGHEDAEALLARDGFYNKIRREIEELIAKQLEQLIVLRDAIETKPVINKLDGSTPDQTNSM